MNQAAAKLAKLSPGSVGESSLAIVCEGLITNGKTAQAKELVDIMLKNSPANITANFFKGVLSEPQPDKIDASKRRQIEEQVYKNLPDPSERALRLGIFYNKTNDPTKAVEQFKIVLGDFLKTSPAADKLLDNKVRQQKEIAVGSLFDIAIKQQDLKIASEITDAAKTKNLDRCDGILFAARLAAARKEKAALSLFDDCLKQRPVFSYGYLFRSNMRSALNDENGAIEDARKAMTLNPLDGVIAKNLANLLFMRNQKLGRNVTTEQNDELKAALENAMRINSSDLDLISFYAEFISQTDARRAISMRQYLLQTYPSVQNAVLLGRMASRIASSLTDSPQKTALFNIAKAALEQGRVIEPANQQLLASIAEMYIAMRQPQQAELFITQSKNQTILWSYYYQNKQYDQAQKILNSLYQANPKDPNAL